MAFTFALQRLTKLNSSQFFSFCSELHKDCSNTEIRIAGAGDQSGTYSYFLETILVDHEAGESFDLDRPGFSYFNSEDDEVIVDYTFTYPESISYMGYSYYFENRDALASVAIQNEAGEFVAPRPDTITDGSYNPLARRIYMNLLNDETSLANTVPFVTFGMENPEMVAKTGFVAIPEGEAMEIVASRLTGFTQSLSDDDTEGSSGLSAGAIAGIVVGGTVFLCVVLYLMHTFMKKKNNKDGRGPEEAL